MAITYPLNTPTNIGIANITLMAESAISLSASPFTYQQQVVAHPGQRWAASISLPPMKRVDAENWIAFLLSLKGPTGTFLLGDPNCAAAQGAATARRNLLAYTEQFDNAAWTKTLATATANAATAPDGTVTAEALTATAVSGQHFVSCAAVTSLIPDNTNFAFSCYFKPNGRNTGAFSIRLKNSAFATVEYNLTTQALVSSSNTVSTSITAAANGFYRIAMVANSSSGAGLMFPGLGDTFNTYTGDNVAGILIWGAQLEIGSAATAYQGVIATYAPQVNGAGQTGNTLNIDNCSPSVTGFLLPGDYIQLGSGATTQLYKVLTQVNTDSAGLATIDIWPDLRGSPADNDPITVASTKGRFRLKENITQWNINEMSTYGITFDCVEAI